MKFTLITTFPPKNIYADKMMKSAEEYLDKDIEKIAYIEQPVKIQYPSWQYLSLDYPNLIDFKNRHKNKKFKDYRWDSVRFAHKSYCIFMSNIDTDYLIWLDADTLFFNHMPKSFLESLVKEDRYLTYLGRSTIHSECGFVIYNQNHPQHKNFMQDWRNLYDNDELFDLKEYHDSFLFDHLRLKYETQYKIKNNNISKTTAGHVFINSDLGQYIDHMKGPRKEIGKSKPGDLLLPRNENYWKFKK